MKDKNLDYKKACENALNQLEDEFWRGAKALYHHLQENIIGFSGDDAISLEVSKFLKRRKK